jgi:DNA polymerase-1
MCALYSGVTLPDRPDPENVRKLDIMALPMVNRMQRFGLRIDPAHFAELTDRLSNRMAELKCDITNEIPTESLDRFLTAMDAAEGDDEDSEDYVANLDASSFNVDSSKKMAELLYDVLGLHLSTKVKIKKTKSGDRLSTGKKTLEQLKRDHPIVAPVLEYKECSKLRGTCVSLPRRARFHPAGPDCPCCGRRHYTDEFRAHTTIMSTRTTSGRLAYKNENLGNIPTRTKLGAEVRAGFIPSVGHVIVQRDWAQIEMRFLADKSGDAELIHIFKHNLDPHSMTAVRAFGKTLDEVSKGAGKMLYRAPCKNVNFGIVYGLTAAGLLDLMALTYATAGLALPDHINEQWCEEFLEMWFGLYPSVRQYLDAEESKALRFGFVWTDAGRVRRIPQAKSALGYVRDAGVREACNHGIQGKNADTMRLAMGELHDRLRDLDDGGIESYELISIYDELLVETEEAHAATIDAAMEDVMENVLVDKQSGRLLCAVPIKSDGKILTERWVKE